MSSSRPRMEPPDWFSESLARGLRVICAFDQTSPFLRISDIADRTGLSRAASRRFVLTLQKLGYISSDGDRFYLLPRVLNLGFSFLSSIGVERLVQPFLAEVAGAAQASSAFAVLDDDKVLVVARASTPQVLGVSIGIGGHLPAHATSLGHVLLSALSEEQLDRVLTSAARPSFTDRTLTDPRRLRDVIRRTGQQGWAVVEGQHHPAISTVAVPVRNLDGGTAAAINLNFYPTPPPAETLVERYVPLLNKAADDIANALRLLPQAGILERHI